MTPRFLGEMRIQLPPSVLSGRNKIPDLSKEIKMPEEKNYIGICCRIYPNKKQKEQLNKNFGSRRFIWNQMLGMLNERYKNNKELEMPSVYDLNMLLVPLKEEYPWLKEADSTSLQQVNAQLIDSFNLFFSKVSKYPKFKSKRVNRKSYKTVGVVRVLDNSHLKIPKIGAIKFKGRKLPNLKVKSATISISPAGNYTATLLFEHESQVLEKTNDVIGLDFGVADLIIGSNGLRVPTIRFDKQLSKQKHYWEKRASRRLLLAKKEIKKDRESNVENPRTLLDFKNYQQARRMVAKYNEKIANQRKDYLHKISIQLIKNYDLIVLENLKTKNMMRNRNLSRAITNQSWRMLREMLEYKAKMYGRQLEVVNPYKTSQICSYCKHDDGKHELKIREWTCPSCHTHHDRDINAAKNILNLGLEQALIK